ncbi:MAG: ribosome biogenesis GTPase Der [Gammaproteobacteria bacterium]|jgi:GTP-binding protein|nr:ribosome biogenesis GTPase Der [Gammaproteobacteria bacterium]MBT5216089.1 ribosome biogenesis GTPase Der [Gammaproteobacteria bacterium]
MLPVIAIVGRPNVGKSTLFNRLSGTKDALVADFEGLTRDRIYGYLSNDRFQSILIDTGGLVHDHGDLSNVIQEQTLLAIQESDLILFVVDGREGLVSNDLEIARTLRKENKPIIVVINKTEGLPEDSIDTDFLKFGFREIMKVSAIRGDQCDALTKKIACFLDEAFEENELLELPDETTSIALIGRPNVGKSTFINSLIRENRLLTQNKPGTTRDSIYVDFKYKNRELVLIDTAGIRRRKNINLDIEKFSIVKALQAVELSDSVIVLIDGLEGITDQDLSLIGLVLKNERALTIAVNKLDALTDEQIENIERQIRRKLKFVNFVDINNVSALTKENITLVLKSAIDAADISLKTIPTSQLSKLIEDMVESDPPPYNQGRRIKLKYAHQAGSQPPMFIIYGTQTKKLRANYKKFIENRIRNYFSFWGTPIRLIFKDSSNPYAEKKNKLSFRQWKKRKRIIRLRKKKK